MRRGIIVGLVLITATLPALGQMRRAPRRPEGQQYKAQKLQGEEELRYIAGTLALDEKQQQHVEGLIEEYVAFTTAPAGEGTMSHIADLLTQLAEARKAGDKEKEKQIQQQLEDARPGKKARTDFLEGLRQILNDQQKASLEVTLKFLETNPSGKVRPLDVYLIAIDLKLSPEQKKALDGVHRDFRKRVESIPDKSTVPDMVGDGFILAVHDVLNKQQQGDFVKRLAALVPNFKMPEPKAETAKPAVAPAPAPGGTEKP